MAVDVAHCIVYGMLVAEVFYNFSKVRFPIIFCTCRFVTHLMETVVVLQRK